MKVITLALDTPRLFIALGHTRISIRPDRGTATTIMQIYIKLNEWIRTAIHGPVDGESVWSMEA